MVRQHGNISTLFRLAAPSLRCRLFFVLPQLVLMSEQRQMFKVHSLFALADPKAYEGETRTSAIIVAATNTRHTGAL